MARDFLIEISCPRSSKSLTSGQYPKEPDFNCFKSRGKKGNYAIVTIPHPLNGRPTPTSAPPAKHANPFQAKHETESDTSWPPAPAHFVETMMTLGPAAHDSRGKRRPSSTFPTLGLDAEISEVQRTRNMWKSKVSSVEKGGTREIPRSLVKRNTKSFAIVVVPRLKEFLEEMFWLSSC